MTLRLGLNADFLSQFLLSSGYENITQVKFFGKFEDTSNLQFKGVPISLNVIAQKPNK